MRVLVTGGRGFAARHLVRELERAGHEVDAPGRGEMDVTDVVAVHRRVARRRPDAIAHLAAVSSPGEAAADPAVALRLAVGGTCNIVEEAADMRPAPALLVVSSSEVYGQPGEEALPIDESARLHPVTIYGLAKTAQESVALAIGRGRGLRIGIVRPFNHTGPGQRAVFVVPALARRIAAVATGTRSHIEVGNIDVRRDIADVRDVVRAYRLLLERLVNNPVSGQPLVVNVASGQAVSIRELVESLCRMAGVAPEVRIDPSLVRSADAPEIRGDASRLREVTGWVQSIPLETTLRDVLGEALAQAGRPAPATS